MFFFSFAQLYSSCCWCGLFLLLLLLVCMCVYARIGFITMSRCIGSSIPSLLLICLIRSPLSCHIMSLGLPWAVPSPSNVPLYINSNIPYAVFLCALRRAPVLGGRWPMVAGLSSEPALRLLSSRLFPSLYVFLLQVPSFFTCLLSLSVFSHPVP